MSKRLFAADWPQQLAMIAPPSGLACVGFSGEAGMAPLLGTDFPRALLIEAQPDLAKRAQALVSGRPNWQVREAVLSDEDGEGVFYIGSNPFESSLLPPESLAGLWKNIKTRKHATFEIKTLAGELAAAGLQSADVNWLVVDCFPALPLIRGAGEHLAQIEVIAARAVLDDSVPSGKGLRASELDEYLTESGYRCIGTCAESHPSIGLVLYMRDWGKAPRIPHAELDAALGRAASLKRALGGASRQRDEFAAKIEASRLRIADLEKTLALVSREREGVAVNLEQAHLRVADLEKSLASTSGEREELAANLGQSRLQIADLEKTLALVSREREGVAVNLEQAHLRVADLEKSLASTSGERQELAANVDQSRLQIAGLEKSLASTSQEREELVANLGQSRLRIADLEQSLASVSREREGVAANLEQAHLRVADLEKSLASTSGERQELTANLDQSRLQIAGLEKSLASTSQERHELATRLEQSLLRAGDLEKSLALTSQEREELAANLGQSRVQIADLEKSLASMSREREESTKAALEQRDELVRQLSLQQEEYGAMQALLAAEQDKTRRGEARSADIAEQLAARQEELHELQTQSAAYREAIARRDADLAEQQRQTTHWHDKADAAQTILDNQQRLLDDLRAQNLQFQQMAHLTTKVNALRDADLKELRERYEAAIGTQQRQHALLVELEDKLRMASQYFHQLQRPNGAAIQDSAPEALVTAPKKATRRRGTTVSRKTST